jgi:hypothetical protein
VIVRRSNSNEVADNDVVGADLDLEEVADDLGFVVGTWSQGLGQHLKAEKNTIGANGLSNPRERC